MKLFADIVLVTFGGLGIALAVIALYYAITGYFEQRKALKEFAAYEKTQDEPVAKARREGL
jgi:hypothetical protein